MTDKEEKPGFAVRLKSAFSRENLKKQITPRRAGYAIASALFLGWAFNWFANNYQIAVWGHLGGRGSHCLSKPYAVYLAKKIKGDYSSLERGGIAMFAVKGVKLYPDGTLFVKFLAGLPGDHVEITRDERILINGKEAARGLSYLHKIGKPIDDFVFSGVLPEKKYYVLGDTDASFDSRYWGPIDESQIVGRAYGLLPFFWHDSGSSGNAGSAEPDKSEQPAGPAAGNDAGNSPEK